MGVLSDMSCDMSCYMRLGDLCIVADLRTWLQDAKKAPELAPPVAKKAPPLPPELRCLWRERWAEPWAVGANRVSKSRTQKKTVTPKNSLMSLGGESEQTLLTWLKPCIVCGHPFFNWFSYEGSIVPMFFSVVSISYVRTYSHTYIMNVCNIKMHV